METLSALQEKIEQLIAYIKTLKKDNAKLVQESKLLTKKLESMESSMLDKKKDVKLLNQEKETTKNVVDDLIKTIDSLVQSEKQL